MKHLSLFTILVLLSSIYTFAQDVDEHKTDNVGSAISKNDNIQAINDKIEFKNESGNSILTITDEGNNSASVLLKDINGNAANNKKLENNSGDLFWGGNPLGIGATKLEELSDVIMSSDIVTNQSKSLYIGWGAGSINDQAIANTALGILSLANITTGDNNTALGGAALYLNQTGSNNVAIGNGAGYDETGSNKLYIENSFSSTPLIGGDFSSDEVYLNGQVGIHTSNPEAELHINAQSAIRPAIFLENATASEGDITWDSGEILQLGTWNKSTNTFNEVMRLENTGDVGINNTNPTHLLDVGTSGAYCNGGAWVDGSSREFKDNIVNLTIEEARKAFKNLVSVKFRYKTDPSEEHLGFVAEDVPDLVATNDRKGLSPMDIVSLLTKISQDQQTQIEKQGEMIVMLKNEIDQLKK